jgi:hypothetical protein
MATDALKVAPRFAPAWNNIAVSYEELNQSGKALSAAKAALDIDPGSLMYKNNLDLIVYHRSHPIDHGEPSITSALAVREAAAIVIQNSTNEMLRVLEISLSAKVDSSTIAQSVSLDITIPKGQNRSVLSGNGAIGFTALPSSDGWEESVREAKAKYGNCFSVAFMTKAQAERQKELSLSQSGKSFPVGEAAGSIVYESKNGPGDKRRTIVPLAAVVGVLGGCV